MIGKQDTEENGEITQEQKTQRKRQLEITSTTATKKSKISGTAKRMWENKQMTRTQKPPGTTLMKNNKFAQKHTSDIPNKGEM